MYDGKKLGAGKAGAKAGAKTGAAKRNPQSDTKTKTAPVAGGHNPSKPKGRGEKRLDAARTAAGTKGGPRQARGQERRHGGPGQAGRTREQVAAAAPALEAAAKGARPADQLKKLDEPATVSGWQALSIGRDLKASVAGQGAARHRPPPASSRASAPTTTTWSPTRARSPASF